MKEKINLILGRYEVLGNLVFEWLNKCKSKIRFDKTVFLVFLSIFLIQYFTSSVIYMYFDDFGNASLSYSYWTPNVTGTDYTFSQLLEWAKEIYMNWGGRIMYAIFCIIPLLKNGIVAYMFVQSIVITLIIYFMYRIINIFMGEKSKKGKIFIPTMLMALYMCINMVYLRHGIYWASASVLYVWPMLPFLAFIYLYIKTTKKIESGEKKYIFFNIVTLMILCFLATFSQEQIGAGVIVFVIVYIITNHIKKEKKFIYIDIPIIITAIISFLLLYLAPGNWARLDSNTDFAALSFIEKIKLNYPEIVKSIFIDKMNLYMFFLTAIMFYMIIKVIVEKVVKENKKVYLLLGIIIPVLIINYYIVDKTFDDNIKSIGLNIFAVIWFISMFIISIIYFKSKKQIGVIAIEFSAISMIFCLLMSPVIGGRTGIPYILMIIMLIVLIMQDIINEKKIASTILIYIVCGLTLIYGTKNTLKNYEGYKRNYGIHQLNFELLQNYKIEDGNEITLYKIGNVWYGSTLSYEEPSMDFWIKEYFNIPQNVVFNWVDVYEPLR